MNDSIFGLLVVMFLSCGLDETHQEDYQSHVYQKDRTKTKVIKEYYDDNGDQITDPKTIKEIEERRGN